MKAVFLFSNLVLKSGADRVMSEEQLFDFCTGLPDWLARITSVSDVYSYTFAFCRFPGIALLWSQLKLSNLKLIAFAS